MSTTTVVLTRRPEVRVNAERCVGCEECARACPELVLALDAERAVIEPVSDACVGCRACETTCPYHAIHVTGPLLTGSRVDQPTVPLPDRLTGSSEVRGGLSWTEALVEANRCLQCPRPTCVDGCPTHNDIPGFIWLLRSNRVDEAAERLRLTSEFPAICGRVCDQAIQCEGACILNQQGEQPVAIGLLERFVGDWEMLSGNRSADRMPVEGERRVAVIGSGPAGLAAAGWLARGGHRVEVFEAAPFLGGILAWGIPEFSLPGGPLEAELAHLAAVGVTFHLGADLGGEMSVDSLLGEGFDAVILAFGAGEPNRLPFLRARHEDGAVTATDFLTRARRHPTAPPAVSDPVVVVGGGNTGIDVARTALRLGARDVTCVDFLPESRVPSSKEDKKLALEEGVRFRYGVSVQAVEDGQDGVRALQVAPVSWPKPTLFRRRPRPRVDAARKEVLPARTVVQAMGYRVPKDVSALTGVRSTARGTLEADPGTGHTSRPGVWAVGDLVAGPSTVAGAMAAGRRCAQELLRSFEAAEQPSG